MMPIEGSEHHLKQQDQQQLEAKEQVYSQNDQASMIEEAQRPATGAEQCRAPAEPEVEEDHIDIDIDSAVGQKVSIALFFLCLLIGCA